MMKKYDISTLYGAKAKLAEELMDQYNSIRSALKASENDEEERLEKTRDEDGNLDRDDWWYQTAVKRTRLLECEIELLEEIINKF